MYKSFNLSAFIATITGRKESFFKKDIAANRAKLLKRIEGKSVLVIGGAGTIGASFVKAILPFKPGKVFVIDTNENGLTELVRDVRSTEGLFVPDQFITYPVNYSDPVFVKIFKKSGPFHIVANFAAHKHVRSEKDIFSIEAMVENNVLRAKELLDLLLEHKPERFFCVSTDKAANPVNVMGASKKLMEDMIMAYSHKIPITTARFANVAFSNGSLPAGFLERLMKRQPFSSPADVQRFFVSPAESGELCMLACMLGNTGDVFFPKLDPEKDMKKFSDIAVALLKSLGMEPDYCSSEAEARQKAANLKKNIKTWPVFFFNSDTSGEKPYEEFFTEQETLDLGRFKALGVVKDMPRKPMAEIEKTVGELRQYFNHTDADKAGIVQLLERYLGNFDHIERGKTLDQKM